MNKGFLFICLILLSITMATPTVFASDSSEAPIVLADMEKVKTIKDITAFRKSKGNLVRYRASWIGELPSGKKLQIWAMSSRHRVEEQGSAWSDLVSRRVSGSTLFVELRVDGEKLMQLETHGQPEMRFDERLPSGELVEVFVDAKAAPTKIIMDIRLLKNFPKIEFLDDQTN